MVKRRAVAGFALLAVAALLAMDASAQTETTSEDPINTALERFSLKLPTTVYLRGPMRKALSALGREKCDRVAIVKLGDLLKEEGYRREAANSLIQFSDNCGGHAEGLRAAINYLLDLSDYKAAAANATKLISFDPHDDNGYFLRGLAYDETNEPKSAIDDFTTAIELFINKDNISSFPYERAAENYGKLGQFCDAASLLETWVALDPSNHDNSQSQSLISDYHRKGNCQSGTAAKEELIPIKRGDNLARATVLVNGVKGVFIVDTGATFLSMTQSFAKKSKVDVEEGSTILMNTANGPTNAKRGRAALVKLRSLQAKNVMLVVQGDEKLNFGDGVDGLLGMSFLSHFEISLDASKVRLKSKRN